MNSLEITPEVTKDYLSNIEKRDGVEIPISEITLFVEKIDKFEGKRGFSHVAEATLYFINKDVKIIGDYFDIDEIINRAIEGNCVSHPQAARIVELKLPYCNLVKVAKKTERIFKNINTKFQNLDSDSKKLLKDTLRFLDIPLEKFNMYINKIEPNNIDSVIENVQKMIKKY